MFEEGVGESELVFLTVAVASIKAWNRIAIRVRVHAPDTTRWSAGVERNDPALANFFAVESENFRSSLLMVQLNFFERSH